MFRQKIGCGSRIWTDDLRVMSPTSYQTAPSRVWVGALYGARQVESNIRRNNLLVTERLKKSQNREISASNIFRQKIGCGSRIWTDDLRVMSPTSYQTAPSRVWVGRTIRGWTVSVKRITETKYLISIDLFNWGVLIDFLALIILKSRWLLGLLCFNADCQFLFVWYYDWWGLCAW